MAAQEYILFCLEKLKKPLHFEEVSPESLEDAIFAKVMSKKFRKIKADDEAVAITKKAIKLAVQNNKPVTVSILFGGNKLWRFDEAPEIDWAEFFSTLYFLDWMKSITNVYKGGARLDFYSEDIFVEELNNIPRDETECYSKTFQEMLRFLKPFTPENISITYRRHRDLFKDNMSKYFEELEEAKSRVLAENGGELPKMSDAQKIATELNVRLKPGQDKDPRWQEKVELLHQSIEKTKSILPYLNDPYLIPACPTLYPGLIATGSTKRSYAKFWAAVGVLQRNGDEFVELVLTPKQLDEAIFEWEEINIKDLEGKNFKRIRVLS